MNVDRWQEYRRRYREWEWRAPIFLEMIMQDADAIEREHGRPVILDIGCGRGFDDDESLQSSIAARAGKYIGIEPDTGIELAPFFSEVHRTFLEDAPIEANSVHLAFSVMVLEHIQDPLPFWSKLQSVLRPGGVFWGFTVDARHWFAPVSRAARRLRLSRWYLDRLHGKGGEERYENYPAFYRTNSPRAIRRYANGFSSLDVVSFARVGQLDFYLPGVLRPPLRALDRVGDFLGLPGTVLAVRAVK